MGGDIAPLPDIISLAKKYHALVYLDDAHATGILGKDGGGTEDHFEIYNQVDVVMGTFTKSFGGVGGFIVGSKTLIDYLRISADSFMFSSSIFPPVVYGLIKSIEIVKNERWRREKLLRNVAYLKGKLHELSFDTDNSKTQIVPIYIGDSKKALKASQLLLENNIFIPAARWPAVPHDKARLRTTLMCDHTFEQIGTLVSALKKVRDWINF
ncbi:MAG: aminotransferase class I/II-fold pyridoxal phosphate-dependent enzyme [Deltaproteobacteria bacterium]|nr:aminotransferase class I/II-fold pyridoxal phosphate-dependent enzyme [Deltaproteobacteria bacterium]